MILKSQYLKPLRSFPSQAGYPVALVFGEIGLIRSLGEAGIDVVAAGTSAQRTVNVSRYVHDKMVFPPYESPEFVEALLKAGPNFKEKPAFFTDNDKPILAFSRNRKRLSEYYRVLLPDEDLVEDLVDKRRFGRLAEIHKLPSPITFSPRTTEELRDISKQIKYPCILKPAHQDLWKEPGIVRAFEGRYKKAIHLESAEDLKRTYEKLRGISPEMILQEFVEGRDEQLYDVHAYFNALSEPVACFIGQKIRTNPIHFGMGCYTRGVKDEEIQKVALDALRRIGYCGIAALNLKRDSRDGSVKILEVNPRLSLWNYLATRSGVNVPALAYSESVGEKWEISNPHRVGLYWIHFKEDFKSLAEYRRNGEWTVGQWIQSLFTKKVYHVFSWRDPIPAFYSFFLFVRARLKRLLKN